MLNLYTNFNTPASVLKQNIMSKLYYYARVLFRNTSYTVQ